MATRAPEPAGYLTVGQPTQCVHTVLWRGGAVLAFEPRLLAPLPSQRTDGGRSPPTPRPVRSWLSPAPWRSTSACRRSNAGRSRRPERADPGGCAAQAELGIIVPAADPLNWSTKSSPQQNVRSHRRRREDSHASVRDLRASRSRSFFRNHHWRKRAAAGRDRDQRNGLHLPRVRHARRCAETRGRSPEGAFCTFRLLGDAVLRALSPIAVLGPDPGLPRPVEPLRTARRTVVCNPTIFRLTQGMARVSPPDTGAGQIRPGQSGTLQVKIAVSH